ncbi:GDSL-type esterase/lipase family protein [Aeoliella sp. ICT_H6.2]|uniref:GDSL-type esterase/lipase family protein n=1 Tax=Aeoliella straminimaris TaxID=2954799 RepID=A0A9X2JGE2_9BACT|nr:GDSL-type esterase/lipase family protein [Aeoliella straminimaris]MCO6043438.1 GDSL-type esterase/lipase family protein [Aeoliella straminimaris]
MNWLVFHIVSGEAFFTGIALLVLAALLSTRSRPLYKRVTALAFLVGVIAVVVSSTAIPYWWYAVATAATVAWIVSRYKPTWHPWAAYAMAVAWSIAACMELPHHVLPRLALAPQRSITIIGDSVTAGVGGSETTETWPSILAREHGLRVQDISHVGETAASALHRAQSQDISAPLVFVEIGGNDILGTTSPAQFASDLDALLSHLTASNRQVMMLELPLPPFYHEYGRAQRTLAAKHQVLLVPKRVFLTILAGEASTLDTIHLSQAGHQAMAERVWHLVKPAYE